MRKILWMFIVLSLCSTKLLAQKDNDEESSSKNVVKLNLFALPLKNISIQYERAVGKKITVGSTFRLMPKGTIPFKSTFVALADDPETEQQMNDLRVGNFAVMPEFRYYLGKKGAFRGFYLGLYANIASYSVNVPLDYDNGGTTETIQMSGKLTGITGGLMIGAQFKVSDLVYLDWWILGPGYGTSNGKLSGQKNMDIIEQQDLRDELADLDIPLTKFTYQVNSTGATMNFKGPWAGIRSGFCVGFRF